MNNDKVVKLKAAEKQGKVCPICHKTAMEKYQPFCSKRCANIDLGKWLGDGYRIPTDEVPGFDDHYGDED